jgi:hypothetical protein
MRGWDKLASNKAGNQKEATMCWLYGEPTLEELLADPTITVLMERDAVDPDALALFLDDVRTALQPLPIHYAPAH